MKLLILFALMLSPVAFAKRELIARAGDRDGHPARPLCFFSNHKLTAFKGELLVKYTCLGAEDVEQELWRLGKTPKLLLRSSPGQLLGDPIVSRDDIFVVEFSEMKAEVLWQLGSAQRSHKIPGDLRFVADGVALGDEHLRLRVTDDAGNSTTREWLRGTWLAGPERQVSYYFSPAASSEISLQKLRLGASGEWDEARPDVIELAQAPEFKPQIVLSDRDADPASPWLGFWNFSVVNGSRWMVIARSDAGPVALSGEGRAHRVIKLYEHLRDLDFWPGAVGENGKAIVRGTSHSGQYGLWEVDTAARLLLKLDDPVATDLGLARVGPVLFYTAPLAMSGKVFIGTGLVEWGSSTSFGQGILAVSRD
ncbi:MAG: hypothetical protein ACLGG7_07990 [Bacteriovoracia bacterium]